MNSFVGYIVIAVGFLVAAVSKISSLQAKITFIPRDILSGYGLYVAGVLLVLGIVLLLMGSKGTSAPAEVPIYEGKRIVGYRRA